MFENDAWDMRLYEKDVQLIHGRVDIDEPPINLDIVIDISWLSFCLVLSKWLFEVKW